MSVPMIIDTDPGVDDAVALLRSAPAPVTLAAIGPLTNIALLLAAHPEVKPKINRIVLMGGRLAAGNTSDTSDSPTEFNIHSDLVQVALDADLPSIRATILDRLRALR